MKKFILSNLSSLLINIFLLLFLIFTIQNNHQKQTVKVLERESIELPISFILGTSLIAGSFSGKLIYTILKFKNNKKNS
tara:strand:+ start:144 stop:380 length:237 start_codon:yes stop_codon:yes gene_type:complete